MFYLSYWHITNRRQPAAGLGSALQKNLEGQDELFAIV
jgi:hypothetical protein